MRLCSFSCKLLVVRNISDYRLGYFISDGQIDKNCILAWWFSHLQEKKLVHLCQTKDMGNPPFLSLLIAFFPFVFWTLEELSRRTHQGYPQFLNLSIWFYLYSFCTHPAFEGQCALLNISCRSFVKGRRRLCLLSWPTSCYKDPFIHKEFDHNLSLSKLNQLKGEGHMEANRWN